ncbi:hypothetical protein [Streptomyces sp. NPDC059009]|uniref:hypothetical protein n=1 Tax=Streptomyces sp. NPDC059009 TaxID=3346694 RepID=UPI003695A337
MAFTHQTPKEPVIRLTFDGNSTTYLLDTPDARPGESECAVYDPRVHAAYVLAQQGHRTSWLAAHLGLPRTVVRQIVALARPTPPPTPLADRSFGVHY